MHKLMSVRGLLKSLFAIAPIIYLCIALAAYQALPYNIMPYILLASAILLLANFTCLVAAVRSQTRRLVT